MSPVRKVCPKCSEENPRGVFNCQECGASLSGAKEIGRNEERQKSRERRSSAQSERTSSSDRRSPTTSGERSTGVVVTDIRMGFGSMVVFMVKWAIATIPAALILATIGILFYMAVASLTAGAIS